MQLAQAAWWKRESGWSLVGLLKTSQQVPEIKRETKGEEFDYLEKQKESDPISRLLKYNPTVRLPQRPQNVQTNVNTLRTLKGHLREHYPSHTHAGCPG